jgi:hypothetical protein
MPNWTTTNVKFSIRPMQVYSVRWRFVDLKPFSIRPMQDYSVRWRFVDLKPFGIRPMQVYSVRWRFVDLKPFSIRPMQVYSVRWRFVDLKPFSIRPMQVYSVRWHFVDLKPNLPSKNSNTGTWRMSFHPFHKDYDSLDSAIRNTCSLPRPKSDCLMYKYIFWISVQLTPLFFIYILRPVL